MSNLGSAQSNGCQCPLGVPWWHGPVTRCPLTPPPPPPSLLFTGSLVGRCTAMVWTPRKQWNVAPAKSLATAAAHLLRSDPPPWPEQPLSTHAAPPPQQYLAILTSRNSDPLALNFGHMRCWCQDANCCINFGHFKLKVVILMCLEVAQSKVVISNTNHFIHWTRQPPISSPRSLLAQSNPGSADKWCPLQTKSGQARKKTWRISRPRPRQDCSVFTVLLESARSWFYLLPPELSPTSRLPVAINRKNTAQREREPAEEAARTPMKF